MWTYIGIGIVAFIAVLAVAVATRPDAFLVQRSAAIAAPPGVIFGYLKDFHKWPQWSPWEKLDPNMQRTFTGAPSGTGAKYAWSGNSKAGAGSMAITDSIPNDSLTIDLDFLKPFKASNVIEFTLIPAASGTEVTWTMTGNHSMATKAFSLVTSMDKLVGGDFERGLANLKAVAEGDAGRTSTV